MICREFQPSELLQPFIKQYIVLEDRAGVITNQRMSIYPSGYPELVIAYGDTVTFEDDADFILRAGKGYLGGQICGPVHYRCSGLFKAFSIILRPWGFYRFMGIPQCKFTGKRTNLEQILGKKFEPVIEKICRFQEIEKKVQAVDSFFIRCFNALKSDNRIDRLLHAVRMIESSSGLLDLVGLAETININIKSMERYFKNFVGMPPKVFSRIIRFNKALNLLNSGTMSPSDIVYSLGYFDQSHFIHEVKQFTGRTPTLLGKSEDLSITESFRELVHL